MKPVAVLLFTAALVAVAAPARAQPADPYPSPQGAPPQLPPSQVPPPQVPSPQVPPPQVPSPQAPPIGGAVVHVSDATAVFAQPDPHSAFLMVVEPADELHADVTQGAWTRVAATGHVGWLLTSRLTVVAAPGDRPGDEGFHRPVGRRFVSGFRLGWMYLANFDQPRADRNGMSIKQQFGLRSPNMFLVGYEGFYRIVGHSWLNIILVGNASVAGLEQSSVIPSLNGLIGVEIDEGFQLGIGISLTPDPVAPSHMIAAAGWTPYIGSIQTPIHFIYIPDPDGNYRTGATVGVNW